MSYNKNRLPEFQRHFLCVLCDFLTDLEWFSVVKVPTVSSLYIPFQGRALKLKRRLDPLKENGHKFFQRLRSPQNSTWPLGNSRQTHSSLFFEDHRRRKEIISPRSPQSRPLSSIRSGFIRMSRARPF